MKRIILFLTAKIKAPVRKGFLTTLLRTRPETIILPHCAGYFLYVTFFCAKNQGKSFIFNKLLGDRGIILMNTLATIVLRKNEDRRLRAGHAWVFSNEIDVNKTPLSEFQAGQQVVFQDYRGKAFGNGYVNPHSLICGRLVTRSSHHVLDKSLLVHRLKTALSIRAVLFDKPYYRLIYGESDGLPGLVVDRFGDILVAQITTAGMENVKDHIITALEKVLKPRCLIFRNDSPSRKLEGLEDYVESVLAPPPEEAELEENHTRFVFPLRAGQKTGWFYDHRLNRARMRVYIRGKRVLDLFSYLGGWGIQAASAGANEVVCIDASEPALDYARRNAQRNNVGSRVSTHRSDIFDALKTMREERARFDVIIVDPPAFIRRKKDIATGTEAYRRVNQLAMSLLHKDGLLISASCSYHMERRSLKTLLAQVSRHVDRQLQILEQGHQGPDHPVHPSIPETEYLKAYFCRVLPTG